MDIKEFKRITAGSTKEWNRLAEELMRDNLLPDIMERHGLNKVQAKYMIIEALHYSAVWTELLKTVDYIVENHKIYCDEEEEENEEDVEMI